MTQYIILFLILVVYAGKDSKVMLNNGGPRYKRSHLEIQMNYDVIWCVIILIVLCTVGAIGFGSFLNGFKLDQPVPFVQRYGPFSEGALVFFHYIIGKIFVIQGHPFQTVFFFIVR